MSKFTKILAVVLSVAMLAVTGCSSPMSWFGPSRQGVDYQETADFKSGKAAFEAGDYDKAIKLLSGFAETNPTNMYVNKAYLMMGQAAEKTQKFELAIQGYTNVIESSEAPDDYKSVAYLGRGNCHFEMDVFKDALKDYRKVERSYLRIYNINPAEVITKIGLTYKMLNKEKKADKYFVRILDDFNHTDYVIDAAANHTQLGQLDATGKGRITVIAGVYLSREKAEAVAVKVQGQGFAKCRVEHSPTGENVVIVDQFISPREAKRVLKSIKSTGLKDCTMVPEMD